MISLVLGSILAIFSLVVALNAKLSQHRGTNKVTRFIRDTASNARHKQLFMINVGAGVLFTITASAGDNQWYAGVPNFAVAILCFYFMLKSNRNTQRVDDARGVTKGSLKVAAATAEVAGTAVGAYVAPGIGDKIGAGIGKAVGSIADSCADSMTDVECNINVNEIKSMLDPEEFMRLATMAGCKGASFEQIAQDVYRNVPAGYIESHSNMSPAQIAVAYLNGSR